MAFAQTASTMFAMDAMLSHRPGHLKMPRPDAYGGGGKQCVEARISTTVASHNGIDLSLRA